jgi:hypothetical protein
MWVLYLAGKQLTLEPRTMIFKAAIGALAMAPLLSVRHGHAPAPLLIAIVLSTMLYVLTVLKLKVFSDEELHLAANGLTFVRPFIAEWFHRLGPRA